MKKRGVPMYTPSVEEKVKSSLRDELSDLSCCGQPQALSVSSSISNMSLWKFEPDQNYSAS